ncbi:MAG: hypothetical protein ACR2IE_18015 [Candidatus Sumerlaeaceae bacterium]
MSNALAVLSYNDLPDIHEVSPLTDQERECLDAVRDVLYKHRCADRFGVMLLHNHFHLSDDEILVESCDMENRVLIAKPQKASEFDQARVIETNWRFVTSGKDGQAERRCVAVCQNDGAGQHIGQDHNDV